MECRRCGGKATHLIDYTNWRGEKLTSRSLCYECTRTARYYNDTKKISGLKIYKLYCITSIR